MSRDGEREGGRNEGWREGRREGGRSAGWREGRREGERNVGWREGRREQRGKKMNEQSKKSGEKTTSRSEQVLILCD